MTTYPATNLKLTYDDATDTWSYTEHAYSYTSPPPPTWSGYTSSDPDFKSAPDDESDTTDEQPTQCPEGYIYSSELKQCIPDPNYVPRWLQQQRRDDGGSDTDNYNYVDFKEMNTKELVDFGKKEGLINENGYYVGPRKTNAFGFIAPFAQIGLNSQAKRYINELTARGAKIANPGETSMVGNLYIPEGAATIPGTAFHDEWSKYATSINVHSDVTDVSTNVTDVGEDVITSVSGEQIDSEKARITADKKQAEADLAKMEALDKGQSFTDDKGDTYTKVTENQTGGGGSQGYSYTPKDPKPVEDKQYSHPAMGGKSVTVGPRAGVMAKPKPKPKPAVNYETAYGADY